MLRGHSKIDANDPTPVISRTEIRSAAVLDVFILSVGSTEGVSSETARFITLLGGAAGVAACGARATGWKDLPYWHGRNDFSGAQCCQSRCFSPGDCRTTDTSKGAILSSSYKSADGDASRFPALISELINSNVDLIVSRGTPASLAAKKATSTIPVVMAGLGEPLLVVASLARPGGNITGLSGLQPELETKRLELLTEIAPASSGIAALLNMSNPAHRPKLKTDELCV